MGHSSILLYFPIPATGTLTYLLEIRASGAHVVADASDFAWIVGDHEHLDSTDEFLAKLP